MLVILGLLLACTPAPEKVAEPSPPTVGSSEGDTLVVGIPFDPGNANPLVIPYALSQMITDLVEPGLVWRTVGEDGLQFDSALAESWSFDETGTVLTYVLKPGLRWEDGRPLTASDVVFSWSLIADPAVASNWHGDVQHIEKYTAIDDLTVAVTFRHPRNPVLQQARTVRGIVPEHVLVDVDHGTLRGHTSARSPLASGPFRIGAWKADEKIVLESNPTAPPEWRPHLHRITLLIQPEYSSRLLELEAGRLDMLADVEIADLPRLAKNQRLRVHVERSAVMQYIGYNLTRPELADIRVRKALTLATDTDKLIADLLTADGQVYGRPCVGTISPEFAPWYADDIERIPADAEAAKGLLDDVGWRPGKVHLTMMVQTGSPISRRIAVLTQAMWKGVGVELRIDMVEPTRFSQRAREKDYQVILWEFGASPNIDPSIKWRSNGQYNWFGLLDPEIDRLIDEGMAATDVAVAQERFKEVQRRVYAAQPATFLFWKDRAVVIDRRFAGVEMNSYSDLAHAERWYVAEADRKYR